MSSLIPALASYTDIVRNATITTTVDAAASVSTTYVIEVDDSFDSVITQGDSDWVRIELDANVEYVFSVWGTGGSQNGLSDTVLYLRDDTGRSIIMNDDVTRDNTFSMIEYMAETSGTYYLDVSGFGNNIGDYTLTATDRVLSPVQIATYITEFNWGIPVPIRFDAEAGDTLSYNVSALTDDGRFLAREALDAWSAVTGIDFTLSTLSNADIVFEDNRSGAFAGPLSYNSANGIINQSTVNIGTQWLQAYGTTLDSYSYLTYMHEIGHALGLGHSGNYDGFASYGENNYFDNDSYLETIMSYFSQTVNTSVDADYALPITPMIADIVAIQQLYGIGAQYNVTNTVWFQDGTAEGQLGELLAYRYDGISVSSDVYAGDDFAATIFDTGGTDLVNFVDTTNNMVINLMPGVGGIVNGNLNIALSTGTILENVSTGSGDDTVTGNVAENELRGNGGNDILIGMGGADRIFGGSGNDEIEGNTAFDVLYGGAGNDALAGGTGDDRLYGGIGNDVLRGDSAVDRLYGGAGDDDIRGGTGADILYGDDDDDSMFGNTGIDTVYGGAGDDFISPGNGVDTVYGGSGDDHVIARTGFDTVYGDSGNDRLFGSEGKDALFGGADDDFLSGGFGFDTLNGDNGNDTLYGNIGADILYGGNGDDTLYGATGNDALYGGDGDDTLYGNQGTDVLVGGAGNDLILSGSGFDEFIFGAGDGQDTITNFRMSGDIISLSADIVGTATNGEQIVEAFGSIIGGNVTLTFGEDLSLTFNTHSEYSTLADSLFIV